MKKNTLTKKVSEIYIDRCQSVHPNHVDHTQEIYVECKDWKGEQITLIFTPVDWIDTFTPTMYEHVKEQYIKYIQQKK